MDDLIKRDYALEELKYWKHLEAYDHIRDVPAVDAVEVVRCIDCKYYEGLAVCKLIGDCMGTDGYCAWGEKGRERRSENGR